jgi:abortive infection bacteriophage resistance protein
MSNPKPWLSVDDQLTRLKDRGMLIGDEAKTRDYLERIGYYRLSGYWFAFRERSELCCALNPAVMGKHPHTKPGRLPLDHFKAGATFENAVDLYVFDKKLRLMAMDALERIEISLRVDISHYLGERDRFAYLNPALFHAGFAHTIDSKTGLTAHHSWLTKQAMLVTRSKEEFIRHNREKYGLPLSIWVACEVWDFGCMSTLFGGMAEVDQDCIAKRYGISNGRIFASWLRSLNYLRNVCAHHCRLWNRNMADQPKLPPIIEVPELAAFHGSAHRLARPFLALCIAQHLMQHINPASTWGQRLKKLLLDEFPKLDHLGLNLMGMGVDEGWVIRETCGPMKKPPSS